jgi:peptidoglycan hydrolase CwlO-like protein
VKTPTKIEKKSAVLPKEKMEALKAKIEDHKPKVEQIKAKIEEKKAKIDSLNKEAKEREISAAKARAEEALDRAPVEKHEPLVSKSKSEKEVPK